MGNGPSQNTVSDLDFELRKVRESQNSSRGVMAKAITPPPLQTILLTTSDYFSFKLGSHYVINIIEHSFTIPQASTQMPATTALYPNSLFQHL